MIQLPVTSAEPVRSAGAYRLESVRDAATLAHLRPEWNALLERSSASVFNAWEWLYPWFQRLAPDRRLMVLLARDGQGRLAGLMPLCLERVRAGATWLERLSFLGERHVGSDYLDVVARAGEEEPVATAFAQAIRRARGQWDVLDLVDVEQGSPTLRAFREVFAEGYALEVRDRHTCPYEPLREGVTFEAFLETTRRAENFLRREKWLKRQPGYRLEVTTSPDSLARPLAELFRLHRMRWAADGGSQGIRGPAVEAFHRDATRYLAERGWLRLYVLRLGEQPLASVYGIVHRGKFIYYQSGYDPAWRPRSVGLVLVGETFRDAIESGLGEYDFLRGTEAYKGDWVTCERKTLALRIWPKGGKGAWLSRAEEASRAVRNVAKRVLPSAVVTAVRRRRLRKEDRPSGL